MADELPARPQPAPQAPPRNALHEVYVELLTIERERLAVAVRIERERGFIFPETSVIVRDVRFLAEKVYGPGAAAVEGEAAPTATEGGSQGREVEAPATSSPAEAAPDDAAAEVEAFLARLGDAGGPCS